MSEFDNEACFRKDEELIKGYFKDPNSREARKFALDYARFFRDYCRGQSERFGDFGTVSYFEAEARQWSNAVRRADKGNYYPLVHKLQGEARELFSSLDEGAETLGIALVNLGVSIRDKK